MRRYIQVIFARKWIVIVALVTVVVATVAITLTMKPVYRATASIYVEQKRPESTFGPPIVSAQDIRIFLQTQLELIQCRTVSERTIKALGLDKNLSAREPLSREVANLQSRITAGSRTSLTSRPSEEALGQSHIIFVQC